MDRNWAAELFRRLLLANGIVSLLLNFGTVASGQLSWTVAPQLIASAVLGVMSLHVAIKMRAQLPERPEQYLVLVRRLTVVAIIVDIIAIASAPFSPALADLNPAKMRTTLASITLLRFGSLAVAYWFATRVVLAVARKSDDGSQRARGTLGGATKLAPVRTPITGRLSGLDFLQSGVRVGGLLAVIAAITLLGGASYIIVDSRGDLSLLGVLIAMGILAAFFLLYLGLVAVSAAWPPHARSRRPWRIYANGGYFGGVAGYIAGCYTSRAGSGILFACLTTIGVLAGSVVAFGIAGWRSGRAGD